MPLIHLIYFLRVIEEYFLYNSKNFTNCKKYEISKNISH